MTRLRFYSALLAFVLLGALQPAAAQITILGQSVQPDSIATRYRLDFAVPDAPAFGLLSTDQSTILRPSSVREIAVAVSDFLGSGEGAALPRTFAAEVSPALLIGGKSLTLRRYQSAPLLYRLRLSAATRRFGNDLPSVIAVGLRVSLIDASDLRTNTRYLDSATAITEALNDIYAKARLRIGPPPAPLVLNAEEQAAVDALTPKLRDWWENKRWNARVLDVAVGTRAASLNGSGQGLASREFAAWTTFGTGFGNWGQLLIGVQAGTVRDSVSDDFKGTMSLSSRMYAGTNRYKVFAEIQQQWEGGRQRYLINAGGETRLIRGGWVSFSAGLESVDSRTDLVTNFAVKIGVLGL